MSLSGKYAVITGGIGGIGIMICKELIANGITKIAILDIASEEKAEILLNEASLESKYLYIQTNLTIRKEIKDAYAKIHSTFKQIDIVVNSAAIFDDANIPDTLSLNIGGVIYSTLEAMKYMSKENNGEGGHIIQLASIAGLQAIPLLPIYCSSKHAVIGFTKCFGNELFFENTGIKFMAICPGATRTSMLQLHSDKNVLFPFLGKIYDSTISSFGIQEPIHVAKCIIKTIEKADNGSIVLIDEGISKLVVFPEIQYNDFE